MHRLSTALKLWCIVTGIIVIHGVTALSASSEPPVTITFAAMKTFGLDTMPYVIQKFQEKYPNIKVAYIEMPSPNFSTEIHQYLVTNLAGGGSTIDVFTIDIIWFAEFAEAGWLLPLDEYFTPQEKAEYFPGIVQGVTYKGQMVGVPWYLDAGMLYYRKDLLDKYGFQPPKTWDELIRQAQVILAGEKNPELKGFVWQGRQAEVLVCDLVEFLGSGMRIIDADGKVVLNSPEAVKAAKLMYDLIYRYRLTPEAVLTYDEEPSRRVFTSGNAIFLRNWSYVWGLANDPSESKVVGKVGVAPLPAFPGEHSAATLGGYQFGINRNTRHRDAAVKFVKFLSSPEIQLYFANKIGFAPTRPAVYDDPNLKDPFLRQLQAVFTGATPRPITPRYPQVSLILQSEFSKLLANRATPEDAVREAARRIEQAVR